MTVRLHSIKLEVVDGSSTAKVLEQGGHIRYLDVMWAPIESVPGVYPRTQVWTFWPAPRGPSN